MPTEPSRVPLVRSPAEVKLKAKALSEAVAPKAPAGARVRGALPADIIDALPGAFYIYDERGRFLLWNEQLEQITGFGSDEIGAMHALSLFEGDDCITINESNMQVFITGAAQADVELLTKDGSKIPFHFTGRLIEYEGKTCVVGMGIDMTESRKAEKLLAFSASHDGLTGLANRTYFEDRIARAIRDGAEAKSQTVVAFIDIDRFKNINETLGHFAGDELLRAVAGRLTGCSRAEDTVGRLGGDEFAIVLRIERDDDVSVVVERIAAAFNKPFAIAGNELHVTASIGITVAPLDGLDPDHLLRNADTAMYQAKDAGRNRYHFYSSGMRAVAERRLSTENDLRRGLERGEFELYYQPTIDLKTGRVAAAEALIRWHHPKRGLVMPGEFIDIAEETGLIVPIGAWVLRKGVGQARRLAALGFSACHISVNVSGRQLRDPGFLADVREALAGSALSSGAVGIEITESAALGDPDAAQKVIAACKRLGFLVLLDDFGTHYSSLTYLKKFPIDIIKIDKSFVDGLPHDGDDAGIIEAIIALGKTLNCEVLAEGIETELQARWLANHGCGLGTGYWYARPMPAEAFEAWLAQAEPLAHQKAARSV